VTTRAADTTCAQAASGCLGPDPGIVVGQPCNSATTAKTTTAGWLPPR